MITMKMIGYVSIPNGFSMDLMYSGSMFSAAEGSHPVSLAILSNNRFPGSPSKERQCMTEYLAKVSRYQTLHPTQSTLIELI